MAKSHVIVGTFAEIKAVATRTNLEGKTLITSAVDDDRLEFFKKHCKVNLAIDVSPKLFDRVVGINTIEAMILAVLGKPTKRCPMTTSRKSSTNSTSSHACCTPRAASATSAGLRSSSTPEPGVHPQGFPIPKGHAKVRHGQGGDAGRAHAAHGLLQDGEHHLPTGAGGRGLADLRQLVGTPKEMLSHSPEFTYRRLLQAAKIAEKMGAQIMGLGAFTKVVGDAGVTVARRASIPITTATAIPPPGACGLLPTPCAAWAWSTQERARRYPPRPWSSAPAAPSVRSAHVCWQWL